MLPSLGATVAAWPLAGRAAAYTSVWATYALVLQALVTGYCALLDRAGLIARPKSLPQRAPAKGAAAMIAVEWVSYASYFVGAGLLQVRRAPAPASSRCGAPRRRPRPRRSPVSARRASSPPPAGAPRAAQRHPGPPPTPAQRPPPRSPPPLARQALVNPSWSDWDYSLNFIAVWWWHLPFLFIFDTYFFFVHRAFHK